MRVKNIGFYFAVLSVSLFSQSLKDRIVRKDDMSEVDTILMKNFPLEYQKYKIRSDSHKMNNIKPVIELINTVRQKIEDSQHLSKSELEEYRISYLFSWRMCIRLMDEKPNKKSRMQLMNQWDASLLKDDQLSIIQIYGLAEEWNRTFLTRTFWQQLHSSKCDGVVSAMCYVLYQHGNLEDLHKLLAYHDIEKSALRAAKMMNARNWLEYRLYGKQTHSAPPALPPMLDYKED